MKDWSTKTHFIAITYMFVMATILAAFFSSAPIATGLGFAAGLSAIAVGAASIEM